VERVKEFVLAGKRLIEPPVCFHFSIYLKLMLTLTLTLAFTLTLATSML
jgi:hypothetical protein